MLRLIRRLRHPYLTTKGYSSLDRAAHLQPNPKQQQHQQLKQLVSILLKHPSSRQATQQVHSHFITSGLLHNHHSTSYILLFNTLLRCYSLSQSPLEAFILYKHLNYLSFDSFTYTFLLHACSNLHSTPAGLQLHALILKVGFQSHVYVQTALVYVYAVCGSLFEALHVFYEMPERNTVTWNVMITGLTKWGHLQLARSLFDQMPTRTVVSWTAIIDGYTRMILPDEAVALFRRMIIDDGIEPTEVTFLAIFPAISNLGTLKNCQSVHAYGEKAGFNASDIRITNSLIDSYAKCGCIKSASKFFEEISGQRKNLVSWTSLIAGFAMHGMGKEALESFERMEEIGMKPNRVTFLSVLNACSHGGLVDDGLNFFNKMVNGTYQVVPDIKHYGCLIDMLARAGRLEEAEKMAFEIPAEILNVVIWRTLLGACSFHGNVEMGERVTRKILEMERAYGGDYVLMSNIFAGVGMFGDAERLRKLMDERNVFKVPGHSLL
jgi:pentatricopeptide repeat protein